MFADDLALGNKYQDVCIKLLGITNYRIMEGNFKEFDTISVEDGKIVLREFKADRIAHTTGNLAIEFMSHFKPSGINVTTADYWCHYVIGTEELYNIPVTVLKDMLNRQLYHEIKHIGMGENKTIFLIKKDLLKDYLLKNDDRTSI